MIEDALSRAPAKVDLPGFTDAHGLTIGGGAVHIGTGGAAVQVLDSASGEYRDSGLQDLWRMMSVLDQCENVHYGIRPLVARDMPTPLDLDINTAYACLATRKPVGSSFDNAAHVIQRFGCFDKECVGTSFDVGVSTVQSCLKALDADGIQRIEELIAELKQRFTIVMVTHNMGQAKRASDECIYMYLGKIIEHSATADLFLNPKEEQTAMYIEGRYG